MLCDKNIDISKIRVSAVRVKIVFHVEKSFDRVKRQLLLILHSKNKFITDNIMFYNHTVQLVMIVTIIIFVDFEWLLIQVKECKVTLKHILRYKYSWANFLYVNYKWIYYYHQKYAFNYNIQSNEL